MNAKHLISGLTAFSLLTPASVSVVETRMVQHVEHGPIKGPLPAAVRQATEPFRDVNDAIAAGYVQNGGCVSGPEEGAMGVHFAKFALFDAEVDVTKPEVLVYEPRRGQLELVAAEYVVPAVLWENANGPFAKPHLMGHLFHFVPGPNRYGPDAFYELHVWAWKQNPRGAFADWNPNASCAEWEQ